jgi:hypothetical protein
LITHQTKENILAEIENKEVPPWTHSCYGGFPYTSHREKCINCGELMPDKDKNQHLTPSMIKRSILGKNSVSEQPLTPELSKIVQMIVFNNELYLATERGLYRRNNESDVFEPVIINRVQEIEP